MSYIKSFIACCLVAGALTASMTPTSAFYNQNGDIIWIIYYPDGVIVI
jgi:hypothetical protein